MSDSWDGALRMNTASASRADGGHGPGNAALAARAGDARPHDELIATCEQCGALVDDLAAHEQFHKDVAMMAGSVLKVLDRVRQQNRLTFAPNLTLRGGTAAADPDWWKVRT